MSLADRLMAASPKTFPSFVSPLGFFSNLNEFADLHFSGFRSVEVYKGLEIYAGTPDEGEVTTDEYVNELKLVHFVDNNSNNKFEEGKDTRLASIKVFITKDGAFLLKKYNTLKGKIKDNEIALFLEYSGRDIVSNAVTLVLAGASAKEHVASVLKSKYIQKPYFLSSKKQKELVESVIGSNSLLDAFLNIYVQTYDYTINAITDFGLSFFDTIEGFFSKTLRIPESFWNVDADGSIMGELGNSIERQLTGIGDSIKTFVKSYDPFIPLPLKLALFGIEELSKYVLEIFQEARKIGEFFVALVCGIWNSVMDTIAGIFGLIKLVIKGVSGTAKMVNGAINYATKADYYNALATEYLDNLLLEAAKIDWKEVVQEAKKEMFEIASMMLQLPGLVWDKAVSLNSSEVGYYVGYIVFELISFIFPPIKIAQLGKLGKWSKFDKIRKASNAFPDGKTSKAVNKVDEFFEFIQPLIKKMREGTTNFIEFIRDVFRKFRKWVEDLLGISVKAFDPDELDWLSRKAVTGSLGGKVLTSRQIKRLRDTLKNKYDVDLIYEGSVSMRKKYKKIDNFKKYDDLISFMKSKRPPYVGMFHAETKQMILLKKPTEFIAFHEQTHMKHWKDIGALQYKKLNRLQKEMYAWNQTYKTKNSWTMGELEEALDYINRLREKQGLTPIIM